MVEEELIIGIKVLAKIHSGEIEVTCNNCSDMMKDRLKCDKIVTDDNNDIIFTDDDLGDFSTCPLKWLNNRVYEWYDEYLYYQMFTGTAPKYGQHNNRFWELSKIYKNEYDSSSVKQMKKSNNTNTTDKSLQSMRTNFNKKKAAKG